LTVLPQAEAALSILILFTLSGQLLFLIYTMLVVRWCPKEITQHQAPV